MNKKKAYLIALIVSGVMMIALIPLTIYLTEGRDIADFTPRDQKLFTGFLILEFLTVAAAFFFADRFGKLNRKAQEIQPAPLSKQEKRLRRRGIILFVVSLIAAMACAVIGIFMKAKCEMQPPVRLLAAVCILPLVLLALSLMLQKRLYKSLDDKRVDELQQMLLSQREAAAKTTRESLEHLKKCRILTGLYAFLLAFIGACIAAFGGWCVEHPTAFILYGAALIMFALARIRLAIPTVFTEDDKTYVEEKDFPHFYALAKHAAEACGCSTPVKISFTASGNIRIANIGSLITLEIGVILLSILSEQELISILCHEFGHVSSSGQDPEDAYVNWLNMGKTNHMLSPLEELFFGYPDTVYGFRYVLYQYAVSVLREADADRAMTRCCDKETAASALLKTYYHTRYEYEHGTYDQPSVYEKETIAPDNLQQQIRDFQDRTAKRHEVWNDMIPREILARSASHPTMKMRLDALGVTEYRTLPDSGSAEYEQERDKAVKYLDQLIYDGNHEDYEQQRREGYLEPTERIEKWKASGEPLVAEEYSDIIADLTRLGRCEDMEQLCNRAIRELPDSASLYAYYIRGSLRLHRYDASGLDDLYHAMAHNHNFVEDSLEEIGEFCCLTGNQEELDRYREEGVRLMQKDKDENSKINDLNRGDKLGPEKLPDGALEEILTFIRSIDRGAIQRIYLVRKTVSDTFFTSAFVVQFAERSDPDTQHEIMHKIFLHLDTVSDWQYSLFDYRDVRKARVDTVPGSLVYEAAPLPAGQKAEDQEK